MKPILSYILLLLLLSGTSIWAYNNVLDNEDTVREKWGKRESKDTTSVLETYARSEVDVDYPGENWITDLLGRYGIDYEAFAKVITYPGSTEGEYSLCGGNYVSSQTAKRKMEWSDVSKAKRHIL